MKITIIGASAGLGLATIRRALDLGHLVTTLSRRKVDIGDDSNLTMIQGSALKDEDLKRAITGTDAILVTLGTSNRTSATTLFSDFATTLLRIHAKEPIPVPVISISGFGCGDSLPYMYWFVRPIFNIILGKVYLDKSKMEDIISHSTMRWEFVRPGLLTNTPLTEKYRVEPELHPNMNIRMISRLDVADYMVKEAVSQRNIGKFTALTGD